ncbi:MAG: phosphate ABC transporter substrate-binding protein PstS [Actinomycetota bacterium]
MTRKRIPVLVLAAFTMLGLLAACGGGDDSSDSTSQGSTTDSAKLAPATLNASGATFPQAFYEQAIASFSEKHSGVTINYGGGGSGKGRTDLQTGVVDFAGSDGLVKEEDKPKFKGPFLYFPTVAAPITVSYKLDGVDSQLQLSPETIAKIFQREIKTWNDKAIAADNPDAKLPSTPIVVARRSDSSGTTENFTKFLKAAAPSVWKLDAGSTVNWPADTQGGNGNSGVAQIVSGTNGAIGYVDFSDAKATNLKWAKVKNKAGQWVDPTLDAASAALAGVEIKPDLSYSPLWADGEAAYPITAPTWILAYTTQSDKAKGEALKAFLKFIYEDGQEMAAEVSYAKLPDTLKDKALAQVDQLVIPG